MKKPVVLRIYKGPQLLGVKQFLEPQIVIGQPGEVQVSLEGDAVSLIHASIEERADGHYLSDLGSVTGTFKNGQRVLDAKIESGDVIQIGDYKVEFYVGAPKPRAAGVESASTAPIPEPAAPVTPPPVQVVPPPVVTPPPVVESKPAEGLKPPSFTPTVPKPPVEEIKQKPIMQPPPTPPVAAVNRIETGSAASLGAGGGGATLSPPPVSPGFVGPRSRAGQSPRKNGEGSRGKKRKTFAPASKYSDVREYVKPSKGTVVEVLVAWRERVIATHHFSQKQTVTIGSHPDNDIVVPVLSARVRKLPILKIDSQAVVLVTQEMRGELLKGQTSSSFSDLQRQNRLMAQGKAGYGIALEQGEMVKIDLTDQISVIVRYVSDSPKPLVAPLFDLTATEATGVILSLALVATLYLYMYLYQPPKGLDDQETQEPIRTAQILLTPPTPAPLPSPPPAPEPQATPEAAKPTPPPAPQKVKVVVADKTQEQQHKASPKITNLTTKNDPGKSSNAAPNKNKTGPRQLTSPKQGGAIKTSQKEGAQMQSKSRDVSKSGVFSVFGNNGAQDQLAQSTTGSGELAGLASAASGKAGSAVDRAGKGLGSELKDTGRGGTGKSLEGIAGGVGTQGRGSGNSGYGTGGLGNKAGSKISVEGAGADIPGSIDREAIRRVIRSNLPSIRACYERQLNRKPDLFGKLVLTWEIGEQGRVVSAKMGSNELGGSEGVEVANCILAKLKTWRFPEPPANQIAEVSYPFLFSN